MNNPTYITQPGMMGGVWRLYHQEGMPIEMTYLHLMSSGVKVDWVEAMADASIDNNLSSLLDQMLIFIPRDQIDEIGERFMALLNSGQTYQSILDRKRAKSPNVAY